MGFKKGKNYTTGHHNAPKYSADLYITVARSVFLEVERRVVETPPTRPAHFWRMVADSVDAARRRVRMIEIGQRNAYDP